MGTAKAAAKLLATCQKMNAERKEKEKEKEKETETETEKEKPDQAKAIAHPLLEEEQEEWQTVVGKNRKSGGKYVLRIDADKHDTDPQNEKEKMQDEEKEKEKGKKEKHEAILKENRKAILKENRKAIMKEKKEKEKDKIALEEAILLSSNERA